MSRGVAVCVGLNAVDPQHYQGWSGPLNACEFDAQDMTLIAQSTGFTTTTILTKTATRNAILSAIQGASDALRPGDIFLISYSGHGGQLPDRNSDEDDGLDETWCLYDGQLLDDELFLALSRFQKNVRVLVFSDSCHSGTVIKNHLLALSLGNFGGGIVSRSSDLMGFGGPLRETRPIYKAMPAEVGQRTYLSNRDFYDKIGGQDALRDAQQRVRAACMLISGCQDAQLSGDGMFNGAFTGMLKTVWNGGKFGGAYKAFHRAIQRRMPTDQTPELFTIGEDVDAFIAQRPFTVNDGRSGMSGASTANEGKEVSIDGHKVTLTFNQIAVQNEADLTNLLRAVAPQIAANLIKAKETGTREWSVSGTVSTTQGGTTGTATGTYTSRDWSVSASGSAPLGGGISGTATVTTGSQGTGGSIGISGTF